MKKILLILASLYTLASFSQTTVHNTRVRIADVPDFASTDSLVTVDSSGNLTANTFALYGNGAIVTSSGNFAVDAGGNLYAENATIYGTINSTDGSIAGWQISSDSISAAGGDIFLYQEPGYGALIAGSGVGQQIYLNSEALLHAEFSGVTTDINFQTDTAYVFRISDGSQLVRISPSLLSAVNGASFSLI